MAAVVFLVVLLGAAVVVISWAVGVYNRLVQLRNNVDRSWSDIDVLLQQRHDELTKLIDTCKGYMKYEQETLQKVTEARTRVMQAGGPREKAEADNMLTGALKTLFAVAENYPDLKANQNFMQLQQRITGVESDLAQRRDGYNQDVNTYNIRIEVVPDTFIARFLNYQRRELFQAAEGDRADVKVSFA